MKPGYRILLSFLFACAFCACGQDDGVPSPAPVPEPVPEPNYISVTTQTGGAIKSLLLAFGAFTETFVIRSNTKWSVCVEGNNVDWLSISATSSATAVLHVSVNTEQKVRNARIVFSVEDGGCSVEIPIEQHFGKTIGAAPIHDMLLIYDGDVGNSRIYNKERFRKLVVWEENDTPVWLFDGFVFTGSYYKGRSFMTAAGHAPTVKQDWLDILDYFLTDKQAIPALNDAIGEIKVEIPGSFHRRKVVIFMPDPQQGQTDWGEIDGQEMDFNNFSDRITSCKWYVDRVLEKFACKEFENIQLAGFYWLTENGGFIPKHMKQVADYIHSKNLYFYWIPYYEAFGYADWKDYGFDRAWYQPNYLFHPELTTQRLFDCIKEAAALGMGVEVEFDSNYPLQRNADYVDAYEESGIFNTQDLTYYGATSLEYWQQGIASERAFFKRIATIISERQKKFYKQ